MYRSFGIHCPGQADATKINVHEDWELSYWSSHFGVSKEKLKQAVAAAGVQTSAVKKHLGK
ncbi:DUF3606 domain-containing protein [Pseudomonas sp. NPDC090202]|uniref:DUF3606 domain-containing protein n=1 Tax=Pseudomonas sp. NPDC090202 TaxID=3364476 RepID=UPI0037F20EE5